MLQYEGKRVRGPNGEEGIVQNGEIVLAAPASPAPLRQVMAAPPKTPTPQTPVQEALDVGRLGRLPLENEQTRTSIESNRSSMANTAFDNVNKVRQQFEAMKPVQDYRVVLPQYASALRAADNKAGDLQIIYAFGKVMDPGSVVREGELAMAQNVGGIADRLKGYIASIQGDGRLPPNVRRELLNEIRSRASGIADQYNQVREQYKGIAERNNLNPIDIVGEHPGGPFQQAEADFMGRPITNLDGSQGAVPRKQALDPEGIGDIGFNQPGDALPPGAQEFQRELSQAISEGRVKTESDLIAFGRDHNPRFNVDVEQARRGAEAIAKGVMPVINTPVFEDIDISDVRSGKRGEGFDALGRGVFDVPTMGMFDEINAATDTIFGDGTYRHNLARQRKIDEYDKENRFPERLSGQLIGGLALPLGEVKSVAQLGAKAGAYGAGYGFGSGEGNIGDRGLNALMGGAAGATGGAAIGAAAPLIAKGIGAGASRIMGPPNQRQNALLQAGTEEGVPLNVSDVFPGARNTVSTLETIPGASGPVQRGIAAGRDAIESRVQELGRGGTPRENMGEAFQDAGKSFVGRVSKQGDRLYTRARNAAGDTPIQPQDVMQTLARVVREEAQTPGGTKAGAVIQRYADAFEGGGPITLEGARKMRSELLSRLRDDGGLSKRQATRITGQIMTAVNRDIERSLTAAGKPNAVKLYKQADRFWAQGQEEIERVTERFIGTEKSPKSAEQVFAAIQSAMGPKGNSRGVGGMLRRLSPDDRKDFAATIVEPLGRAAPDAPFSPALFISQIGKVSPASRRLVFGADGERSIQNLLRLSEAKKATVQNLNNARSGMVSNYRVMLSQLLFSLPGGGAILGMATGMNGATGLAGGVAISAAATGTSRMIAKAMMNERFTRLLAGAPPTTNPAAINAHIGKLRQLAAKDPNVRAAVQSIEQQLLKAANDNLSAVTRSAASPGGADAERQ